MQHFKLDVPKIRELMYKQKLTKRDLAAVLELSETQTYRKLDETSDFKADEICAVAETLGVTPGSLFKATDEKTAT